MPKYVQLLATKYIRGKKYSPGDFAPVGSQTAEEWIAAGDAVEARNITPKTLPSEQIAAIRKRKVDIDRSSIKDLVARINAPASIDPNLKVAVGMIVFNGDHILQGVLESVYPWAYQICIAEGPVKFHAERLGVETSTDKTVEIIRSFPDPDKKISLVQGTWPEKVDMSNAWLANVKDDADYVWMFDCDEMYLRSDVDKILSLLGPDGYDSVSFRFRSFYGGFDRHMTGWEEAQETHRIQRFYPGATWATHRPPTINSSKDGKPWRAHKHLPHWEIDAATGIRIFHYSFVFPSQVEMKYLYYDNLTRGHVVQDGFRRLYLPWMRADEKGKFRIEKEFQGVHHLVRGDNGQCVCHTIKYGGKHPQWIEDNRAALEARIREELTWYE